MGGDDPPRQIQAHADTTDDGLGDDTQALNEGQVEDRGATACPQQSDERCERCSNQHEGQQPVAELNDLVDPRRRASNGNEGTRVALWPRLTAEAGAGHADEGSGEGDTRLADQQDEG